MSVTQHDIETLQKWLETRLPALIAHGDKVRQLLGAANGSEQVVQSAMEVVFSDEVALSRSLTPQQVQTWKALLPILAEHGLLAVKAGGTTLQSDPPMNKQEAAGYLGVCVRKLESCMKKRQISYEKLGAGRTASVRFRKSELDRYRESRQVSARKS